MFRLVVIAMAVASMMTLNAGQIQIGTGVGGVNGLTGAMSAGVTSANSTVNAGLLSSATDVTAGRYVGSLFNGSTTSALPNGNPSGGTLTANGVTFALVDDSAVYGAANTMNLFLGANYYGNGPVSSFTIPINVYGVTAVDTLMNDEYGFSGQPSDVSVTLNFSTGSLTYNLINGLEIRSATQCTGVGTEGGASKYNDLGGGMAGTCQLMARTIDTTTRYDTSGSVAAVAGAPSVGAFNVFSGTYSTNTNSPTPFYNTSGTISLDAQDFSLGSFSGSYLSNIVIKTTDTASDPSRIGLSAVTVTGMATPEPASVMLILGGLGALVIRRRSQA